MQVSVSDEGDQEDKQEDLLAATPPLEARKMLFSLWASVPGMRLDFGDVVRAYFRAKARRRVRLVLSKEDFEEGNCGLLWRAMRGTCDALQNGSNWGDGVHGDDG